jgi:transposase
MFESGGMTTRDVAKKLGISQTSAVRLKRGSRRAKFRRARRPPRVR